MPSYEMDIGQPHMLELPNQRLTLLLQNSRRSVHLDWQRKARQMLFESESATPQVNDRRTMRRFDMRLPALVKVTGEGYHELLTETQNVSARGVFFYLDRPVTPGTKVEVTLTLPSHVTLTDAVRVRFTARVVRVQSPLPASRIGVAALIEQYEFLRSPQSPEFFGELERDWKMRI
jgi:PilZ domain